MHSYSLVSSKIFLFVIRQYQIWLPVVDTLLSPQLARLLISRAQHKYLQSHLANSRPGCLRLIGYICSLFNGSCQVSRTAPNPLAKPQHQGSGITEGQHQSVQWLSQLCLCVSVAFLETGWCCDVCHYLNESAAKGWSRDTLGGPVFPLWLWFARFSENNDVLAIPLRWKTVLLLVFCSCEVTWIFIGLLLLVSLSQKGLGGEELDNVWSCHCHLSDFSGFGSSLLKMRQI